VRASRTERTLKLVFTGVEEEQRAALALGVRHLRQWLNILADLYQVAGWSTQAWPTWLVSVPRPGAGATPLH
jgi:hypothetical protein